MKLLTKNSDYAIRALATLALHSGKFLSASEIAKTEAIPYQFLRRILQRLIQDKLVIAKEGNAGGAQLAVPPSKIKVLDVIQLFQGEIQISECMFRKRICQKRATCVLRHEIGRIEKILVQQFKNITLQNLIHPHEKKNH
jgi:Rrf2 family protein